MIGPLAASISLPTGFRSRRRGAALALFAWLLLAQTLLVVHRIDHNTAADSVSCALCVAADHAAAPVGWAAQPIVAVEPSAVASNVAESAVAAIVLPYRSRAPPISLRS